MPRVPARTGQNFRNGCGQAWRLEPVQPADRKLLGNEAASLVDGLLFGRE
jgi:hypothetical protein